MKRKMVLVLGALIAMNGFAQKCVNPHFDAQRLDFRDLGYPGATEIPADSSPITALLSHGGNGKVYGATSGRRAHLFARIRLGYRSAFICQHIQKSLRLRRFPRFHPRPRAGTHPVRERAEGNHPERIAFRLVGRDGNEAPGLVDLPEDFPR